MADPEGLLEHDPLWYKDAVVYELHVRAFHDSDGDGIGDFRGLTEKLDYLQELGVTALWLLPFYPSPLRDDGYDIADYRDVHPSYGTLDDFELFLGEAHRRGLRVITELVVNHTSDQHAWFQKARHAKRGSAAREFYVWSDDAEKYAEARVIFQDFEPSNWTWDPVAEQYFWHRFYHHQPDLNFDNPAVHRELFRVLDYWLRMGVDGMRLDAIPYLYERDGTNCENLPETHAFLKRLRGHLDENFDDRLFLAEANQWPEDAAAYFGDGDECHMNFHFPIMPRLFMALRQEDRFPIVDILEETPPIPPSCQWAMFLRNHDELTLEMVTDEERDYMVRVYASDERARINLGIRRRLAPLLQNDRRKIELMNSLLFSLPGTPVLYYGDEIGMGDNFYLGDRNGVRTPMQWSADRNAGFSRANPQRLYLPIVIDPEYHYESVNVEAQQANPSSLLWWTRRMIALRKRHRAFGRGDLVWLNPDNKRVLAFAREHDDETIVVVANLSRFAQSAELDLSRYEGLVPAELLGRARFPRIGQAPYPLTFGPHAFYWFALEPAREWIEIGPSTPPPAGLPEEIGAPPVLALGSAKAWDAALRGRTKARLEAAILAWLRGRRWYAGKGRETRDVAIVEEVPFKAKGVDARVLLVRVDYVEEEAETYVVPVAFMTAEDAAELEADRPEAVIARLALAKDEGVVVDALALPAFATALLEHVARRRKAAGKRATVVGVAERPATEILAGGSEALEPRVGRAEQSNTSILYDERWILKLFRRLEEGTNLDREVGRALTEAGFPHTPAVAGALEVHRGRRSEPATLAVLQEYVENEGDAWAYTLDALDRYLERALAEGGLPDDLPSPPGDETLLRPEADGGLEIPDQVHARIGFYLDAARLLGQRTAELHGALARVAERDDAFAPEPFRSLYQRSLYQAMRNTTGYTLRLLSQRRRALEDEAREAVDRVLERREAILGAFRRLRDRSFDGFRIRTHGDYHLGQVLYTGKDFVVIDFEGEPARPLSERRLPRSPLRDVAGMARSFHYATWAALFALEERGLARPESREDLVPAIRFWHDWVRALFLRGYAGGMAGDPAAARLLPTEAADRRLLLETYLLEKALYELRYEIENRPGWIRIPVEGILHVVREPNGG